MPLTKVSLSGPTGLNAQPVAPVVSCPDNDHTFAVVNSTNKQLLVMLTPVHGLLGLSGQHAQLHAAAVTHSDHESTVVLANAKNRQ